jgi:hypothetical protein
MCLTGDLKIVLEQLTENLKKREAGSSARVRERMGILAGIKQQEGFFEAPELHSDASPLLPQRIVWEV